MLNKLMITAAILGFCVNASAKPVELECNVTGNRTEVEDESLPEMGNLRHLLDVKKAKITVDGRQAKLILQNQRGTLVQMPVRTDQFTNKQGQKFVSEIELTEYTTRAYAKRGEIAFANDLVLVLDDTFGLHFDLIFNRSAIESGNTKELGARIWTASVAEPQEDLGNRLYNHTNVYLECAVLGR